MMKLPYLLVALALPASAEPSRPATSSITAPGLPAEATAVGWPRWRGPNNDGISMGPALTQWPEGGPAKVWSNEDVGLGYSSYAITGGLLYTMGARDVNEFVIAVDTATGKEKWATEVGALLKNNWGDGPRGTPAVDGNKVYAITGKGVLSCLDATTGALVWKTDMVKDLGGRVPGWGYTESPLVEGNMVICTPGGGQGTVAAFDKATGTKAWQSEGWSDSAHYSSAIVVTHNGVRQVIQRTMESVAGVNVKDGKVLWKTDFPGKTAVIPSPIFHEGRVFVAAGYGVGCKSFVVGADNSIKDVYENKDMVNHHGGVILHQGHLYGFCDGKGLTCMEFATGAVKWTDKKVKKGALHGCNDQLVLLEEDSGTAILVDASPAGFAEHGRFKLDPQTTQRSKSGRIWTHPVIQDGRLYLRDQELLHVYDVSAKK
jgi:outer membrane protein assembly factor BamB